MKLVLPRAALGLDEEVVVDLVLQEEHLRVERSYVARTEANEPVLIHPIRDWAFVGVEEDDAPPTAILVDKEDLKHVLQQLGLIKTMTTVVSKGSAA